MSISTLSNSAPAIAGDLASPRDVFWPTRNPIGALRSMWRDSGSAPLPPGPRGLPFVGVRSQLHANPFEYVRELHRTYGDVVRLPMPFYDVVMLANPDHIAQTTNVHNIEYSMVGPARALAHRIAGSTIPIMEGEAYRARRNLIMPMFGHRHLAEIADTMIDSFTAVIDGWEKYSDGRREMDLQHGIARATLAGFVKSMYSIEVSDAEAEQLNLDLPRLGQAVSELYMTRPLGNMVLGPNSARAAIGRTMKWIEARIEDRLADSNPPQDLLQLLIDSRDENGSPLSRKDLRFEVLTLLAGGYETVVAALSWTLALLPTNPAAQQRLYAEIDELEGQRPTFGDLERLTWTKACFDEGQRLQGHPFMPRFAMVDDVIGGYRIRRGTLTALSFYAIHRDSRWWGPEPDRYDPANFYDRARVAQRPNLTFIPFGSGPRRCLGSQMAYMNAQLILALIHQRYRIHLRPGWSPQHAVTFSVPVEGGLPVTLTRIESGPALSL